MLYTSGVRIGSIFSGIGGLELGLERAGLGATVFHAELDPYCSRVLKRHWPGVPNLGDVRNVTGAGVPAFDLLAGGFPCQPVSNAGKRLAQDDPRWLWPQFERIIGEFRPSWVIAENVPGLRKRGLGLVLSGLADLGYDAEWIRLSAAAVGAPHLRERLFLVAYPQSSERGGAQFPRLGSSTGPTSEFGELRGQIPGDGNVAHTNGSGRIGWPGYEPEENGRSEPSDLGWWAVEPDVGRVANGIPQRLDRLRALGNAVVPQCSEFVGRCILRAIGGVD